MAKHNPYGSLSDHRKPEHIELFSHSPSNSPYPSPNPTSTDLGYYNTNDSTHALRPYTDKMGTMGSSSTMESYHDDPAASPTPITWPSDNKRNTNAKKPRRKGIVVGGIIVGIVLLIAAVAIPVYFLVIKKNSDSNGGNNNNNGGSSAPGGSNKPLSAVSGGDGSQITLEDGRSITYNNKFGGRWYYDPNDPLNLGARAQEWSPALNETFHYGVDKIRGVNLGGWLVTEPFIVPALYEKYYDTGRPVDEWELTAAMAAAGTLSELEDHYKTFITEEDFAQIAAAGLNYVRIPIGYWAIEVREGEPFLPKTSWTYFLKAIQWARKYGLRINLDIHALPGGQNGWNHSGRINVLNWLHGTSGIVNAQRSLTYIRTFAQFICQPQYKDVIGMFGIVNEPLSSGQIGLPALASWSFEAYQVVKSVCGTGEGHGPYVSMHHGFESASAWVGLYPNADRVALDLHPYLAFNTTPYNGLPGERVTLPCANWGNMVNGSQRDFGVTTAGEWSLAINDCGQWLNGIDLGTRIEGTFRGSTRIGSCDLWSDWPNWNQTVKTGFMDLALTSMDSLQNSFFWTWKIGNSSRTGKVEMPFWSYSLGLQHGWIPTDPRTSHGACARAGVVGAQYTGPPRPWQTGGAGAGQIPIADAEEVAWPPPTIREGGPVSLLPTYTPTGVNPTLAPPTQPAGATKSVDWGNGWFNPADTQGAYVPIEGCTYPDPWATGVPPPTSPFCPGRAKRDVEPASPTPAPKF